MKAVITVTGKDSVGIIAKVATECAKYDANIIDISQSVLSEYFAMIMLADIDTLKVPFLNFPTSSPNLDARRDSISTQCTRIFLTQCTLSEAVRVND